MSFLMRGLSNLIGLVVPIVYSFKLLKKPTNKKLILATQYWTVFGSFLIVDWLLSTFYITCFVPFYDFFVLMFTILMTIPQIGFASMLYTKFLAPFLRKYERRIDRIGESVVEKVWQHIPGVAATIPSILNSLQFLSSINSSPVPMSQLQIEDVTEMDVPRAIRPVNRSVEVQSEDDDDDMEVESFTAIGTRHIKLEPADVDDDVPVVVLRDVQNLQDRPKPAKTTTGKPRRAMQTRRQTKERSFVE